MKNWIKIALLLCFMYGFSQKPFFVNAKTKSAIVYFKGVELQQNFQLNLPGGTHEIVIKNVANTLNENTLQIGVPANVTVLSSQFTTNYISEYEVDENNPVIKKVRDSITLLSKEIKKTRNTREAEVKLIELLDKNQQVFGNNNGLNVTELIKMADYYKAKRKETSNSIDVLDTLIASLNEKIADLNRKLEIKEELEEKTSTGKLVIQVMNSVAGNVNFEVSYISQAASWSPFYDLRAQSVKEAMQLVYKAQVVQNTGVDWKKVKLTLSSGNPSQNNQAPLLSSWFLNYASLAPQMSYNDYKSNTLNDVVEVKAAGIKKENRIVLRGNKSISEKNEALVVIDGRISNAEILQQIPPNQIKTTQVLKGAQATALYGEQGVNGVIVVETKKLSDYTTIQENELNVSFDIDLPYDIMSNGKVHSVALKDIKIPATYKYYTAPKADKEAFLLAEITDYAKYNLLPGNANIIFEDSYVGKTTINPNQTNGLLNVSLGRDKKVSVKREKVVEKSGSKFLSSKTEQTFTYDIVVRNNKKEAISITVKDQIPLSSNDEIEVELLNKDNAEHNLETGILTWNLELKPNETKKIRLSYLVKYPKDKLLGNL